MLIGRKSKKPNHEKVRHIKKILRDSLQLPDVAVVTITERTCLEEGCAPIETIVGLLRPKTQHLVHKPHKDIQHVNADDLIQICSAWGLDIQHTHLEHCSNLQ